MQTKTKKVEGATTADGRSESIWDRYVKDNPSKIRDGTTAARACDYYHRYEDDAALMQELKIKNYRLSLSWGRIVPSGRKGGAVNQKGIDFYNRVIDSLLAAGIVPVVTLFHWDLPQANQDAYKGFLGREIVEDFVYFADVCFKNFGDRVKKWTTFNEPQSVCNLMWGNGDFAPGVNNGPTGKWTCGHNLLLAHAYAVKLYRDQYQKKQGGKIGMALWSEWSEPLTDTEAAKRAAQNKLDADFGWFADPLYFGDYPSLVKSRWAPPEFNATEKALLKGSYDYMGLTIYTGKYATADPQKTTGWWVVTKKDGNPIGEQAESYWLYNVPWSISRMLSYMDQRYGRPEIWVLENGISEKGEAARVGPARLDDPLRTKYFRGYIGEACGAVKSGVRLTHYFAWSFMDNWEWREGESTRFGLVRVDFDDPNLPRTPKQSALYLRDNVFSKSDKQ
jgi:beta-glucosidase/6-phospho-beta-glucosidase/beta-galactosidase